MWCNQANSYPSCFTRILVPNGIGPISRLKHKAKSTERVLDGGFIAILLLFGMIRGRK